MSKHKSNLDLLRAIAILLVIIYHISQYVEILKPKWHSFLSFGAYGVDIFFVLSGWLIGGIFFREHKESGNINFKRFWLRRWLRTLPPYYIALCISWLAVYLARGEKFDIGYLLFLQNYYPTLPFFKISWSLCVEEHFYLFLPPIFYFSLKYNFTITTCLLLLFLSLLFRLSYFVDQYPSFGFLTTASHLRLDGLSLGVLCSYIYIIKFQWWSKFSLTIKNIGIFCGFASLSIFAYFPQFSYSLGIFTLSIFFCSLLCLFVDIHDWKIARSPIVKTIALSSYSIYLIHSLVINIMEKIFKYQGIIFAFATFIAVLLSGYLFRLVIEKPSMKIRERLSP